VLELLAEGRHTADDMKRILKQEADAGRRWWRGRRLRTDPGSFSFWASEKEGRNHGYRAYEDASGYWHVEAREEPALKPVRYGA
jgi:sirohydrochlorin ferrochelatase